MKRLLFAMIVLASAAHAQVQVDTSSYRQAPQPSVLDNIQQIQQIEIQPADRDARMQIEQQRMEAQQADPDYRRQMEFECQQAEAYRKRRQN